MRGGSIVHIVFGQLDKYIDFFHIYNGKSVA